MIAAVAIVTVVPPAFGASPPGTCLIEANQVVRLSSSIEGRVTKLSVRLGDKVKAGEVVAELDSEVERALLASAKQVADSDADIRGRKADVDLASRKLARTRQLAGRDVLPQSTLEEQETQLTRAQVALDRAEFEHRIAEFDVQRLQAIVDQRIIKSPIDGIVTKIAANIGEHVEPSVPVAVISEMAPLRVDVSLAAAAYKQVQPGMRVEVRPSEPFGGILVADIVAKDPVIDTANGSFQIVARLPNADGELPAGVKCTARLLPGT
jgi:RND family efflux transporter MFP subunit